ncbi:CRISPR-associated endonuclease Cas2 [Plasticicumulans acidivorans]|uniref:CRISPR-associated endoribonuclease Cas2 n=1 Tax=Plasticicumulans acidivorans TaxID=886464 RepID=A0A317MVK2_9GAMM|nr:CRISPR-associated endonuclease Cas2 [Plasticicumulans acidivorans]PWV62277.1 CRISPR-associated Cas2 family protein [Plasticicumulans acidivorans]
MAIEHLYVVVYDIRDTKRWRRVFRLMKGFGDWVQLSVFQCRLNAVRHAELVQLLDNLILHQRDHVILMDMGPADGIAPRVISLGQPYTPIERGPAIF